MSNILELIQAERDRIRAKRGVQHLGPERYLSFLVEEVGEAAQAINDCRDVFPLLEPVDAVVTDPLYGTTSCLWDEELYLSGVKLAGFNAEVLGNVG